MFDFSKFKGQRLYFVNRAHALHATENLVRVQELGSRRRRDPYGMVSITLQPDHDTPYRLTALAALRAALAGEPVMRPG